TVFDFPSFEPTSVATYPSTHLLVPMRKDILHRAVVYEGDATRQGTANTKWRAEVHGSGRKIRPQKGTGMARLGDKKSPMLRGGGVAFGPKPRDFATGLPRRVYDFAWRIALSYRYRQGELMLLDNETSLEHVPRESRERYLRELLVHNHLSNASGRTLFVTLQRQESLYEILEAGSMGKHALAKDVDDVDVKDLLELGRIVVEKRALHEIFMRHQSDL
ncbi:ribosomal protein L4 domain-containing protein, partial [Neohortaea acidophila]